MSTANIWDASNPQEVIFEATNLNDQPITADISYSIYKLQSPKRVLRKKPWDIVEWPYLEKEKFIELFPHEPYDSSDIKEHWKKGTLLLSETRKIDKSTTIPFAELANWKSGTYVLEAKAVDVFQDTVSVAKRFELFHPGEHKLPDNKLFSYKITNSNFKNDGFVEILFSTSSESLHINLEAFYKGGSVFKAVSYTHLTLPTN